MLKRIANVKKVLMVCSGKGGVGKSTVAVALAVGLARRGLQAGLLDLDLFGPTAPRLLSLAGSKADISKDGAIMPLKNFGVYCMSMGLLSDRPAAWRGLMVMKGVQELMWRVRWPSIDVLILDTPPGTGDTLLTVCQQVVIDGAVVVSTPQQVAVDAAERGVGVLEKLNVPIKGIVENMTAILCAKCGHENEIFPSKPLADMAVRYDLKILGSLPLDPIFAADCEAGRPVTSREQIPAEYNTLIDNLILSI